MPHGWKNVIFSKKGIKNARLATLEGRRGREGGRLTYYTQYHEMNPAREKNQTFIFFFHPFGQISRFFPLSENF